MARKTSLGRGLEALMGEAYVESGSAAAETSIALSKIKPNRDQPRKNFDEQELEELTDSIRQNGVLQPILIRPKGNGYEIVAGERRYQAAKKAGLTEIPAVVREISDKEVLKLALIENLQRSDLDSIEEARGMQQLIEDEGYTQAQLAEVISKSRSAVANALRLLDLPVEIQEYLATGQLTAGHARAILAVPDVETRIKLAEKVVRDNLTVRQTENLAPLFSVNRETTTKREPSPQYFKRAARELRETLGANVKIRRVRNRNKIEIEFTDEDDLKRIIELLESGNREEDTNA